MSNQKLADSVLYTIGTAKLKLKDLDDIIEKYHITSIIDVRNKPYGWQKYFHKAQMQLHFGIVYKWLPNLGGFTIDEMRGTDTYYKDLGYVRKLLQEEHNVVLMCSENMVEDCHRATIAEDIEWQTTHLQGDIETGKAKYPTHKEFKMTDYL